MKTQIKSLVFVAAVAILPVACGTSAPTGVDVAAIEAGATLSALRSAPGLPPQAPDVPSPESVPNPADPGSVPEPAQNAPTAIEPDSGSDEVPPPANRPGHRPAPQPSDPGVDTSPNDETGSDTVPTVPTVPTSPLGDPGPGPTVPPADPGGVPAPPSDPGSPIAQCQAASITIQSQQGGILPPDGMAFQAVLMDKSGVAIEDSSCEKVLWTADSSFDNNRVVINYGASSRFVTIAGMHGTYKVSATTPNGQTTVVVVDVP